MEFGEFTNQSRWSREHSSANAYQGGAWLTFTGRAATLITGIIDFDPSRSYYGYGDWKSPAQCDPEPERRGCRGGRGWRAADPRPAFLFYDPAELVLVATGKKKPWEVQWYAKLDLSPYMLRRYEPTMLTTGADAEDILVTFDRERGLIYVSESFVDGAKPVIHMFRLS
jgi:hypothetical protein